MRNAVADQLTGVGKVSDVDAVRWSAGYHDDSLARTGQAGRIRQAGVAAYPEAANEHVECSHPRRDVLAWPEILAQDVDDAGVGVDCFLHRHWFQNPSVHVAPPVDDQRRKQPGETRAGIEQILRRPLRPPPGQAKLEVGGDHMHRDGSVGQIIQRDEAADERRDT